MVLSFEDVYIQLWWLPGGMDMETITLVRRREEGGEVV